MKGSIGTTLILQIFLILFVVYVSFMAVVINYTKVFRIKNQIISIIEKNNGFTSGAQSSLEEYFENVSFDGNCVALSEIDSKYSGNRCEVSRVENVNNSFHYKIVVFVKFDVPFVKEGFNFPIIAETKNLYS